MDVSFDPVDTVNCRRGSCEDIAMPAVLNSGHTVRSRTIHSFSRRSFCDALGENRNDGFCRA